MRNEFPSGPEDVYENLEGKKTSWFIDQISNWFGDKAGAESLLRQHLNGRLVVLDDGQHVHLIDCYLLHRAAYQKREQFGHPHTLRMLETYLTGLQTRPGAGRLKPETLDDYDRKIDSKGIYKGRFGKWKKDNT